MMLTGTTNGQGAPPPLANGADHAPPDAPPDVAMPVLMPGPITTLTPALRTPGCAYGADVVERVRLLIVGTTKPISKISKETGPSETTIANWMRKHGWERPPGAPDIIRRRDDADANTRRGALALRLHRALSRQLKAIEKRAADPDNAEKDARALAILAKTFETLNPPGRDDGVRHKEPDIADRADVTARLAERIARWADGGT